MRLSIKLLESNQEINDKILQALMPQVDDYLKTRLNKLRRMLPPMLRDIIQNTPEYNSLIGGQLQYEFGMPDPGVKLANIIDIWTNNIHIEYNGPTIVSNKLRASFSASLIRRNFDDVLSSDYALVIDNLRGYQLPWLEWLLLEGNKTIIKKQEVVIGPNKFSRTGNAIMRQSSRSWKVPSEFAGTIGDNWITRAIDNAQSEINQFLDSIFS